MNAVHVDGLTKVFPARKGEVRAVDGISFQVERGEIFGLLGPNGAGKTTTLRMLATLLSPTAGRAEVFGHSLTADPNRVREHLGFLATETGLYERLTPQETLRYFGLMYGLAPRQVEDRARAVLDLLGLWPLRSRRVGSLSTGERQKLSFARCLVHDPPLLILDEPTAGLDVFVARTVVELIRELAGRGKTVLLSTHQMQLAGKLCGRVGIIHQGKLVAVGTPAGLGEQVGGADFEEVFFRTLARAGLSLPGAKGVPQGGMGEC
ncbi:MAG: ABC transporter ATP-binding protein [Candidatus Bipolaricaulaceae bacterium]